MKRSSRTIENIRFASVAPSSIHGLGLMASQAIECGSILGNLDGQFVDSRIHPEVWDLEWNGVGGSIVLARCISTLYSYLNHSRHPNLSILPDYRIVAKVRIDAGQEMLVNYMENGIPEAYLNSDEGWYLR